MTLDLVQLLAKSGVSGLDKWSTTTATAEALRRYVASLNGAGPLDSKAARLAAVRDMKAHKVPDAHPLAVAAFAERAVPKGAASKPNLQGQAVTLADPEPWPEPVDGAALLNEIRALHLRYAILPTGAPETLAVFALASHVVDAFNTATYLFLTSPTPECGKTRVIEVAENVVRRPWRPAILTGPVLFRGIEQYEPTCFVDEAEVVRQRSDAADNVRAILHFGYRRGATVDRCVGDDHELHQFRTFGFKLFACIGDLPGTLLSRCIVIPMRRRAKGERVARFVPREVAEIGVTLRRKCQRWATDNMDTLRASTPSLPLFLEDRRAEIWEPLFAVAEVAGWSAEIARAAEELAGVRAPETDGVELLKDIRDVFITKGADKLATKDLLAALNGLEGQPWADLNRGRGLTAARLAAELKPFGVQSGTIRLGGETAKGYLRERLEDAFRRYLALPGPLAAVTPSQPLEPLDEVPTSQTSQGGTCDVSENGDDLVGTGIVTLLRPEGGPARGISRQTCPKGHALVASMCPICDRERFLAALDAEVSAAKGASA